MIVIKFHKYHLVIAFGAFKRGVAERQKDVVTPFREIKEKLMFRPVDRFIVGFVLFTVSGIKTIVSCHFKVFFRYVLDEQFDKVHCRESFLHIGVTDTLSCH